MLVTNFGLKYILYKVVLGMYQVADVGRIHPVRERAIRALDRGWGRPRGGARILGLSRLRDPLHGL